MTRRLVITGTDTGVGKTVVTAAIAALALADGLRVSVVKPVQTGVATGEPGDLDDVRRLSGADDLHELARLPDPLAPGTAARRAGVSLPPVAEVATTVGRLADADLVLVEGAGGLLVELDTSGGTLADLAGRLRAPVLLVTRAGLGTLSVSALTCEALRSRELDCAGVVVGSWPAAPGTAERCNLQDLPRYTGVPLLGWIAAGAGGLERAAFLEAARSGLDPGLLRDAIGSVGVGRG